MTRQFARSLMTAAMMALALTGCVTIPEQQAFNREAHANIKTVAVLETRKTSASVFMLNNPGMRGSCVIPRSEGIFCR